MYSQHAQRRDVAEGVVIDEGDAVPLQHPAHKETLSEVSSRALLRQPYLANPVEPALPAATPFITTNICGK